jgi:PIH1 N-terminal domain
MQMSAQACSRLKCLLRTHAFCASCYRPQPGFVIKTTFTRNRNASSSKNSSKTSSSTSTSSSDSAPEKLFVNIVQSDKVGAPVREPVPPTAGDSTAVTGGYSLKLPHFTGPLRMEKDNKSENTPSFDVCFHPEALSLCAQSDQAKVSTAYTITTSSSCSSCSSMQLASVVLTLHRAAQCSSSARCFHKKASAKICFMLSSSCFALTENCETAVFITACRIT